MLGDGLIECRALARYNYVLDLVVYNKDTVPIPPPPGVNIVVYNYIIQFLDHYNAAQSVLTACYEVMLENFGLPARRGVKVEQAPTFLFGEQAKYYNNLNLHFY